jgi:hypothetical protein
MYSNLLIITNLVYHYSNQDKKYISYFIERSIIYFTNLKFKMMSNKNDKKYKFWVFLILEFYLHFRIKNFLEHKSK